jgi:hypothetical protein
VFHGLGSIAGVAELMFFKIFYVRPVLANFLSAMDGFVKELADRKAQGMVPCAVPNSFISF